jgi:ABC-type multidrug transport system fused ATPase/permease subunit
MRLLTGLEPLSGNSMINYNTGSITYQHVDVTNSDRFMLFSVLGQDTDLFGSLPLVDNILYGSETLPRVNVTEENTALSQAVMDANLSELLGRIPGGWQAQLGPRGRRLSGGERQRVCLARALYRQHIGGCILLLDEPTSALDAQSEQAVVSSIAERVRRGATSITVSHRLSAVSHCDHILVLQNGRVTEQGSHEQLMQSAGWYAEAWDLQHSAA